MSAFAMEAGKTLAMGQDEATGSGRAEIDAPFGQDIGIVSTGFMTERALDAAAALEKQGIGVGVLHCPTIKPFDTEAVIAFARSVGQLVSAENHVVVGGLGSLVAETLFDAGIAKKLSRIGIPDRYIECGSVPMLQDTYGLTTGKIVERIATLVRGEARP